MNQNNCELTVGSLIDITMPEDVSFHGAFVGYTMIGTESVLVIKVNGEKTRYVPVAQIVYIDLVKSAECVERKERPEHLYG